MFTRAQLQSIVQDQMEYLWYPDPEEIVGTYAGFYDNNYYRPSYDEINQYYLDIKFPSFSDDLFDCEDFAYLCKGWISSLVRNSGEYEVNWAFGIAIGQFNWMPDEYGFHACNWFVNKKNIVKWLEPQNGEIYRLELCREESLVLLIV